MNLLCTSPYHALTVGQPGHVDILGTADRAVTGCSCLACAAYALTQAPVLAGAVAKTHVDNPTADPIVLAAGGADLAMINNVNEVRGTINAMLTALNLTAIPALLIVNPTADGPGYVKAAIDTLTGS